MHNALLLPCSSSPHSPSSHLSSSLNQNIREFRVKKCYIDHQIANTNQLFVLKNQKFFGTILFQNKPQQRGIRQGLPDKYSHLFICISLKQTKLWTKICLHCQNPEKIDFATMLYFEKVFVFCRLTNKSVLEWFLLIMCKKHTLSRGTNLFGRNTFFVFDQEEKISKCTEQILYQTETSIHWRCSIKNVVRKNFAIFTVKHLC